MAKNAIGLAIATEEYGAKFFANGAAPAGVLEHPGTIKDPLRVKESWNSAYQGSANAHKIAVLEEGMKYTPIGIAPEQAQFLETRKFRSMRSRASSACRRTCWRTWRSRRSATSNSSRWNSLNTRSILGSCVGNRVCAGYCSARAKSRRTLSSSTSDGLLRGDYVSRMSGYATARQNGWMSANDIRELENLDRIAPDIGGDLYLINGAMTKLEDAGLFAGTQYKKEDSA